MADTAHGRADFSPLGDIDAFEDLAGIFSACELGRDTASNSGLVVAQFASDVKAALLTIPVLEGNASRRARRVIRHLDQCVGLLRGVQVRMSKVPVVILDEYEAEIRRERNKNRKRLNLGA